jgi:glycosyltransferase involved in cell wall biosynthesis
MKIVIVAHYFLPHVGGIEYVVYNQAKELARRGHEVVVISSRVGEEPKEELMDGFKVRRLRVWNIFEKKWGIPYPVFWPTALGRIKNEIKSADLIYAHDSFYLSTFWVQFLRKRYNKPFVLMQHIKKVNDRRRIVNITQDAVHFVYSKKTLKTSPRVIVCNKDVMKWINRKNNVIFMKNCVDINLFKPLNKNSERNKIRKKYKLPIDKPVIIFVGRLFEKKGFQKLFEARDKDYFILFVGNGLVPDYMKKDQNTKFIDFKPQKELSKLYASSDMFCLPSTNEGFPLTILEAMACGLPIITTDHAGYDDYLDRNFVKLINPEVSEIKKSIKELIENKKKIKDMSNYSRKTVEKKFSWEVNVNELEKMFKEVIKENEKNKKAK